MRQRVPWGYCYVCKFRFVCRSESALSQPSFNEIPGALIMPVRVWFAKALERAARSIRDSAGIVYGSGACRSLGKPAEQGDVVATTEKYDGPGNPVRQPNVPICIPRATALVRLDISGLAEGDVIFRRQKIRTNQAPSGRKDIETVLTDTVGQYLIRRILVEPPRRKQSERIDLLLVIVTKHLSPGFSCDRRIIRTGVYQGFCGRRQMRFCDEHYVSSVRCLHITCVVPLSRGALYDDNHVNFRFAVSMLPGHRGMTDRTAHRHGLYSTFRRTSFSPGCNHGPAMKSREGR